MRIGRGIEILSGDQLFSSGKVTIEERGRKKQTWGPEEAVFGDEHVGNLKGKFVIGAWFRTGELK